ncbi:MAG: hypothetical protein R3C20_25095 [Planctomycetaceae bacterium]
MQNSASLVSGTQCKRDSDSSPDVYPGTTSILWRKKLLQAAVAELADPESRVKKNIAAQVIDCSSCFRRGD